MPPGGSINSKFSVGDMFDFYLVVFRAKIQVIVADNDDRPGLDRMQRCPEVMAVLLVCTDIAALPGPELAQ